MYESPDSLKEICIDFISDNIEDLIKKDSSVVNPIIQDVHLYYSNKNMKIPQKISEELISGLSEKNNLNDVTISIFDSKHCTLSHVYIPNAKDLSTKGLKKLKNHKINELRIYEMRIPVSELIGCLGEWTQNNLKLLNVTDSSFSEKAKRYCFVIVPISKLKDLQKLSVRGTDFNNHALEIVVQDLPNIESLDISQTRVIDILALSKIRQRLKCLAMHDIKLNKGNIDTIKQLSELKVLDVSEVKTSSPFDVERTAYINELLENENILPNLTSLDISEYCQHDKENDDQTDEQDLTHCNGNISPDENNLDHDEPNHVFNKMEHECHEHYNGISNHFDNTPGSDEGTGEILVSNELSGIKYVSYKSELQMPDIIKLIQKDLSEPYSIYTYRYFIHNWPRFCFLAMDNTKCVGAIVCKLDIHRKVIRRGYIAMLAVDKDYRKKKIGSNLVLKAIYAMVECKVDEVVLETEVTNHSALKLYENLGFVRDKRLFRYYLNGVDALRLKLWLR